MTRLADVAIARLLEAAVWPALPPDRYEIRRPLGRGGMGTVYAGHDRRLDREVAIKVSNAVAASSDLESRLRQEAHVLARLEHPGIVPVHDVGTSPAGRTFYAMKPGVPIRVPDAVPAPGGVVAPGLEAPALGAAVSAVGRIFATPQSRTSTSPNAPTMTFCGFRSQCTTPRACANATASHTRRRISRCAP